jgi:tRNA1(Val) A37 N6-methylase TrmN6
MGLMFQRIARNFARDGYFPTDGETTRRVLSALAPCESGGMRLLDPCAGEGVALAECKHHLGAERAHAFGIEYDEERAWHAKRLLDTCVHGDFMDCIVGRGQFGLLWLNPPYGDQVADRGQTAEAEGKGRKRLEKLFYQRANGLLQAGGVLVLIIPRYSLDKELGGWLVRHFERLRVFLAPEQRFQQIVCLGVRRKGQVRGRAAEAVQDLIARAGEGALELPGLWPEAPYEVPPARGPVSFAYTRLDGRQLAAELGAEAGLWPQFTLRFGQALRPPRRPLRDLSSWHLALALAAGQVSGVVRARDGRVFVVKGDTYKDKVVTVETEIRENGSVAETRIHTDRFVPVIRALDFTPGSPGFGQAITIQ